MDSKKNKYPTVATRIKPDLYTQFRSYVAEEYGPSGRPSEALRDLIIDAISIGKIAERNDVESAKYAEVDTDLFYEIKEELRMIGQNVNTWTKVLQSIRKKNEKLSSSSEDKLIRSVEALEHHIKDIEHRIPK